MSKYTHKTQPFNTILGKIQSQSTWPPKLREAFNRF